MDPSRALVTDTFEHFFYKSYILCICYNRLGKWNINETIHGPLIFVQTKLTL